MKRIHPNWPKPRPYAARSRAEYHRWHQLAYGADIIDEAERNLLQLAMEIDPEAWRLPILWKRRVPSLVTAVRVQESFAERAQQTTAGGMPTLRERLAAWRQRLFGSSITSAAAAHQRAASNGASL